MVLDHTWIVDDDAIFTFTTKRLLEMHHLTNRIEVFPDGLKALEKLQENEENNLSSPNIILLDINMPLMDGWQFMDEFSLLEDKKNILVYLVSSSIDPRDREKARRYKDIQDFVVKPISLDALIELYADARQLTVNISQS